MSEEIKPCPFCGSDNTRPLNGSLVTRVVCGACVALGPQAKTVEAAIALWNAAPRRPKKKSPIGQEWS
jgi:Lar family restriction alleviation protein